MEENRYGNSFLIGDAGYTLSSYLMIPLANPQTRAEQLYNESHIRTRNVVERQYGTWKRRFPILKLEMRVKLVTIQSIIVSTAILHNIAILNKDPEPEDDFEGFEDDIEDIAPQRRNNGENVRQQLINNYFEFL